jgi:LysM repeat protein
LSQRLTSGKVSNVRKRLFKKHFYRSRKRFIRYSLLTANAALLIAVVGFISTSPSTSEVAVNHAVTKPSSASEAATSPLDQLSSADIAVHVARLTRLDETTAVINHADSVNSQLAVAPTSDVIVAKPQIVATELKSKKDIFTHVVQDGETVADLASRFGVTSDSIRWSNNIRGDRLEPGQELLIPPTNGIVYTVKEGDTIDSLVHRYNANRQKLIEMNDAEVEGLKVGDRIIVADGIQPATRAVVSGFRGGGTIVPRYGGNGYDYGWCTWHAANRRIEIGRPLPTNLGNAITWYSQAQRSGLPVGGQPQAGAVLWHANLGGLGHVAFVERVNDDGSILVSDMNYPSWGRVTYRTVPPSEFGKYRFIY